jgi:hypothetical protein
MTDQPTRQLLHLLISPHAAKAFEIATQQQQSGLGRPVLVLGPAAARLTPPAGVETLLLEEAQKTPAAGASRERIDYHRLLTLIFEAESVSVW